MGSRAPLRKVQTFFRHPELAPRKLVESPLLENGYLSRMKRVLCHFSYDSTENGGHGEEVGTNSFHISWTTRHDLLTLHDH